jgi:hypothetical protein
VKHFKFADSVWHRVVQCVQEGMLTGTDVTDSLRQISVSVDENDPHVLVLTPEYQTQVREMHDKMLAHARELQAQRSSSFIVGDGEGGNKESN